MIINPDKIVFNSELDVVDYVSKGLVPTRKNFLNLMDKMSNPDSDGEPRDPQSKDIYLPERVLINCDSETMNSVLRQVYANRVRNRNIVLTVIGVVGGIMLIGTIRGGCKKKDKDDDDYQSFASCDILDDGPVAKIERF